MVAIMHNSTLKVQYSSFPEINLIDTAHFTKIFYIITLFSLVLIRLAFIDIVRTEITAGRLESDSRIVYDRCLSIC